MLDSSNEGLVNGIHTALTGTDEPVELGIRLIDAYLDWARGHGPGIRAGAPGDLSHCSVSDEPRLSAAPG
ncbi:hypothetical protein OHB12_10390 [Nocardia sp. NBC_01730]|uniref:hypothetical protein n=1 Tax=Nocardia sp. NBC_01730 TaxID=2975998 RepID=UPI002E0D65B8|nr:hypothetical protein OHB12_10390 [Nocardia sp. NBC_01730]